MQISVAKLLTILLVPLGLPHLANASDPPAARTLPRYQFHVGDELTFSDDYRSVPQPKDPPDKSQFRHDGSWKVWVLAKNADGSHRLLVRHDIRLLRINPAGEVHERFSNRILGYCDLTADGRFVPNPSLGDLSNFLFLIDPHALWIPLPTEQQLIQKEWSVPASLGKRIFACSIDESASESGRTLVIKVHERELPNDATDMQRTRRLTFHLPAGSVSESQEEVSYTEFGKRQVFKRIVKSEQAARHSAESIERLQREADLYFKTSLEFDKRARQASRSRTVKEFREELEAARLQIDSLQKQLSHEVLLEQHKALLKSHAHELKSGLPSAESREKTYALAPVDWELTDLDGKVHRSRDYRGKVVILDYWYRSCSWCVFALPQVKQLAEKYQGKPVAVLGINVDSNIDDARVIVKRFDLKFPQLRDDLQKPVYSEARNQGFPVLYVLDQTGRIREIHSGYSVDLAKNVSEAIDGLLKEGAAANK